MKSFILTNLIVLFCITSFAQEKKVHKWESRKSTERHGLFLYWGYNRSAYTKSDIRFYGQGYDFTIHNAKAKDRPSPFNWNTYFNPTKFTVPQFNIRLGYNFLDNWSVSFGYDHMKYVLKGNQTLDVSGSISGLANPSLEGNYDNTSVYLPYEELHIEHTDGLNYFRLQFNRIDQWYRTKKKQWFAINTFYGIGTGFFVTVSDYNWNGEYYKNKPQVPGYSFSIEAGVQLDFFNHFFIRTQLDAGFGHIPKIKLRDDQGHFASHHFFFLEMHTSIGGIIYLRKKQ